MCFCLVVEEDEGRPEYFFFFLHVVVLSNVSQIYINIYIYKDCFYILF